MKTINSSSTQTTQLWWLIKKRAEKAQRGHPSRGTHQQRTGGLQVCEDLEIYLCSLPSGVILLLSLMLLNPAFNTLPERFVLDKPLLRHVRHVYTCGDMQSFNIRHHIRTNVYFFNFGHISVPFNPYMQRGGVITPRYHVVFLALDRWGN